MKETFVDLTEFVSNGSPRWSDPKLHDRLREAGVALSDRGVIQHPFEVVKDMTRPAGNYVVYQGERG